MIITKQRVGLAHKMRKLVLIALENWCFTLLIYYLSLRPVKIISFSDPSQSFCDP